MHLHRICLSPSDINLIQRLSTSIESSTIMLPGIYDSNVRARALLKAMCVSIDEAGTAIFVLFIDTCRMPMTWCVCLISR